VKTSAKFLILGEAFPRAFRRFISPPAGDSEAGGNASARKFDARAPPRARSAATAISSPSYWLATAVTMALLFPERSSSQVKLRSPDLLHASDTRRAPNRRREPVVSVMKRCKGRCIAVGYIWGS
jgi:hypothetical protein